MSNLRACCVYIAEFNFNNIYDTGIKFFFLNFGVIIHELVGSGRVMDSRTTVLRLLPRRVYAVVFI